MRNMGSSSMNWGVVGARGSSLVSRVLSLVVVTLLLFVPATDALRGGGAEGGGSDKDQQDLVAIRLAPAAVVVEEDDTKKKPGAVEGTAAATAASTRMKTLPRARAEPSRAEAAGAGEGTGQQQEEGTFDLDLVDDNDYRRVVSSLLIKFEKVVRDLKGTCESDIDTDDIIGASEIVRARISALGDDDRHHHPQQEQERPASMPSYVKMTEYDVGGYQWGYDEEQYDEDNDEEDELSAQEEARDEGQRGAGTVVIVKGSGGFGGAHRLLNEELETCQTDLRKANSRNRGCERGRNKCNSDFRACRKERTKLGRQVNSLKSTQKRIQKNLRSCRGKEKKCTNDLQQCEISNSTYASDLVQCEVSEITCSSDLEQCEIREAACESDLEQCEMGMPSPTPPPAPTPSPIPPNDDCQDAGLLHLDSSVAVANTENANTDGSCYRSGWRNAELPAVWYTFVGNGRRVTISTCTSQTFVNTDFFLFQGRCSSSCLAWASLDGATETVTCSETNAVTRSFTFDTEPSTEYTLKVWGSTEGQLGITVDDYIPAPNDNCNNAGLLPVDNSVTVGSTVNATIAGSCYRSGWKNAGLPAVWYTFVGTGKRVTITTCNSESEIDTDFFLFSGRCSSSCLSWASLDGETETDTCDSTDAVARSFTFDSESSTEYTVKVWGSTEGTFGIRVFDYEPAANDICNNAGLLPVDDSVTVGSTINATVAGSCYRSGWKNANLPAVWYTFVGTGRRVTVTTCNSQSEIDTDFFLFSGRCSSTCLAWVSLDGETETDTCGSTDAVARSFTFDSESSTEYTVKVWGTTEGQFGIRVFDYPAAANDFCNNAGLLPVDNSVTVGSTVNATIAGSCYRSGWKNANLPAVWYTFVGNGKRATVTTCNSESEIDTDFFLFSGRCGSTCLSWASLDGETETDACDSTDAVARSFTFDSESSTEYTVKVWGSTEGTFGIRVFDYEPAANDICNNAGLLPVDNSVTVGSTINATVAGRCYINGWKDANLPAVWYTFVGTGRRVTVTTCNSESEINTDFFLFSGRCGSTCLSMASLNGETMTDTCGSTDAVARSFTLDSVLSTEYTLKVWGSAEGQFGIRVFDYPAAPNDICANAGLLPVDGSVSVGNTENATVAGRCYRGAWKDPNLPALWYTFVGTGRRITISTCNSESEIDTDFFLFSGRCGTTCLSMASLDGTTETDACDSTDAVARSFTFDSELSTEYTLKVWGSTEGDFGIKVFDYPAAPNDICTNAGVLPSDGSVTVGSTVNATAGGRCYRGGWQNANLPAIWYTFIGTGNSMTISTCTEETEVDSDFFVFSGRCGTTCLAWASRDGTTEVDACVDTDAVARSYTFDSVLNTEYTVKVWGSTEGQVGLSVDDQS